MAIYKNSRYTKTPAYVKDGILLLTVRSKSVLPTEGSTYYTVIQGDTVEGIAYKVYNNAQLFWAILDANPQYQSELDLKEGDVIEIPSYSEVVSYLDSRK